MKSVKVLLPAIMLIALVGCQKGGFKYESIKSIQGKSENEDYQHVATIRIVDEDKVDEDGETVDGPYIVLGEKTDKEITKDPYHRKVTYDDENLYIKQDNMLGYKTKLFLLENKSGDRCLALFRSKKPVRSSSNDSSGGFEPSE